MAKVGREEGQDPPGPGEVAIAVRADVDVARARRAAVAQAGQLGLDRFAREAVAISVSELAANLLRHAHDGEIRIRPLQQEGRVGVEVEACDLGPGIADIPRAMQDDYSTTGGLGGGLPGARRLMDDFSIESRVGEGTRIVARKWRQ